MLLRIAERFGFPGFISLVLLYVLHTGMRDLTEAVAHGHTTLTMTLQEQAQATRELRRAIETLEREIREQKNR